MKTEKKKSLVLCLLCIALTAAQGQQPEDQQPEDQQVERVHVIFKTHLDVGFTDLSSKVEERYIKDFIPRAMAVAEELHAEGGEERYVWTTGSWLIAAYFAQASPEMTKKLEEAIRRGDIVWNGVPYTFHSETMTKDFFAATLQLSKKFDERFGKKTVAAKLTDVPGHTRSIISPMYDAGIRLLHIGVNPASKVPETPPLCLWRNTDGKELILMYQKDYGDNIILPDGKTAMSLSFTGDNIGPHSADQVKKIFADLRKRYPNAKIFASTLNAVAEELTTMTAQLPVVTSEIGDTWIYGCGSSPMMVAKFRALLRLYADWVKAGKLDPKSDIAVNFAVRLGLVAEHTWGADVKSFMIDRLLVDADSLNTKKKLPESLIQNKVKPNRVYDFDGFHAYRHLPAFRFLEESWKEKAANIDKAIALLPANLQNEAKSAIAELETVTAKTIVNHGKAKEIDPSGAATITRKGIKTIAGEITYQTFSIEDYRRFFKSYMRAPLGWAFSDFGKPGLDKSNIQSATVTARAQQIAAGKQGKDRQIDCLLTFPDNPAVNSKVFPEQTSLRYIFKKDGSVEMTVSMVNKPAVRAPEAWWASFYPSDIVSVFAHKMGCPVDVLDVVKGGNRQMHGIDSYVDIVTGKGTLHITSLDAMLVVAGERNALNYSTELPDLNKGIHFCLFNNLWGTNFTMWWEGSIDYRFKLEFLQD
ncbi:MAG: DUF5054 domain-containing protein [Prevotellaceae bacterium]|jgi:hypothetical protein|nr:DUF5054 domain-containing protein [Prevotellaceae bacterium]